MYTENSLKAVLHSSTYLTERNYKECVQKIHLKLFITGLLK